MTVADNRRISEADRAGLAARSPEGHAAKSMHIRGREEEWIQIQANTFKNWANVNLREAGLQVEDLATDFSDGVRYCNHKIMLCILYIKILIYFLIRKHTPLLLQ